MLKTQENQILEIIQRHRLSVKDFDWSWIDRGRQRHRVLMHKPTEATYEFWTVGSRHFGSMHPGSDGGVLETPATSWLGQLEYFYRWAQTVKIEHDAPDLWAQALAAAKETPLAPVRDEPLSENDRESIARLITGLKGWIAERMGAQDARLDAINEQLEYVQEASTRLGKKDWVAIAVGVVVTTAMSGAISPEDARSLLNVAWHGIQAIIAGAPLLPKQLG